jgi:hypothetical protein
MPVLRISAITCPTQHPTILKPRKTTATSSGHCFFAAWKWGIGLPQACRRAAAFGESGVGYEG